MPEDFELIEAVRERVPLLVGLAGPSGGGKTYSALELATGMQQITGGDIHCIDTEARRALHYADQFKFKHLALGPPFSSSRYLEALRYCKQKGAGITIVDSMSHEHEGPGGLLEYHEKELDRLGGDDRAKRERVKFLAWQRPKKDRRALINALLQMEGDFIFCFRAKRSVKPVKVRQQNGQMKTEIVEQGFIPIAGDEFVFEMTVNFLLLPHADGVPTWESEYVGERLAMKLPSQFRQLFAEPRALDEQHGVAMAEWARGGAAPAAEAGSRKARLQELVGDAAERLGVPATTISAWVKARLEAEGVPTVGALSDEQFEWMCGRLPALAMEELPDAD